MSWHDHEQPGPIKGQRVHPTQRVDAPHAYRHGTEKITRLALGRPASCLFEGDLNLTGHCRHGRHHTCGYSTETTGHDPWACTGHPWYRCPCPCHETAEPAPVREQLALF